VSLTLVNADTDFDIQDLGDGEVLDLSTLPTTNLNVRANTGSEPVASVVFGYNGNQSFRIENQAPFALAGDLNGDYYAWTPSLGEHTLIATPYSAAQGGGTAGQGLTISFTVVEESDTVAPMPPENLRIELLPPP
jgi:hypothetical protein